MFRLFVKVSNGYYKRILATNDYKLAIASYFSHMDGREYYLESKSN